MKSAYQTYLFFFFLLDLSIAGFTQNNSDCEDAVSVCNMQYDEQNSPAGTGQIFEMAPNTCQTGGEFNSAWYVFSPQTDGPLSFILEPNGQFDDYDWSLFNITDNGCEGINSGASPEISCNSYGENTGDVQGPTGISTDMGGFGSTNGPGNFNGPPFNADVSVSAGNVYALVIMNFSSTLDGYTLDFGSSQSSVFDSTPPELTDVVMDCQSSQVDFYFSENINIADAQNSDFQLQLNGATTLTPTSFSATNESWSDHITLQFSSVLAEGSYTTLTSAASPLADVCGNEWSNSVSFEVEPLADIVVTINPACNGENGGVDLTIENSADGVFTIEFDNALTTSTHFTGLDAGTYELIVTNSSDCSVTQDVVVSDVLLTANAGTDQVLCDMQTQLNGSSNLGSITWQSDALFTFSNPNAAATNVTCSEPGAQIITCVATHGDCTDTDDVSVTFSYPPQITVTTEDASCFGNCDGQIEIVNSNSGSLTITLAGQTFTGQTITFEEVCEGDFDLFVVHSPGCSSTFSGRIDEPAKVVAGFDADNWIVKTAASQVVLTNTSLNATTLEWQVLGYDSLYSTDSIWHLELPKVMGFYTVKLTAYDANQCSNSVEAVIEVRDEFRFFIPNTFTPNSDDINDVFLPKFSYPPSSYHLIIYNRDGAPIFDSTDPTQPWLGEMNGGTYFCPDGVYDWVITVRGTEIEEITHRGHINLVR